jgi:hypothetical protein
VQEVVSTSAQRSGADPARDLVDPGDVQLVVADAALAQLGEDVRQAGKPPGAIGDHGDTDRLLHRRGSRMMICHGLTASSAPSAKR